MTPSDTDARREPGQDDVIGQDRLARSVLRVLGRMPMGSVVAVHGAPGSGKAEFFRRLAWLAHVGPRTGRGETIPGLFPAVVWYDPWAWSKQGGVLAGIVAAVARSAAQPQAHMDRAREIISNINKLRLDGEELAGQTTAFSGLETDPVEAVVDGFVQLVDAVKGGRKTRLLIFVDQVDRLAPGLRLQVLDGMRLLMLSAPGASAVICVGREAAEAAIRHRDGEMPDQSVQRELSAYLDLAVTVPGLDVRRIGTLLRDNLGPGEALVRRAFGPEAITGLSAAVAHRPLGSPRLLSRLAWRVQLLAEYAHEARVNRELTESQWAWVIVSERWPAFRRFMIRGGRDRWVGLKQVAAALADKNLPVEGLRPELVEWLDGDLLLADYLRLHADGFGRDTEGIFWLEGLMLAGGL